MKTAGDPGRILYVDLSKRAIRTEDLDLHMAKKYLGGQGINTRLIYDLLKPGTDPLSPENVIILGAGALCGTPAIGASKILATTRFPLNGAVGTAAGCGFAPMLKWAGYGHVVISGASDRPVYLLIDDDDVRLIDAGDLWGKDIFQATDAIRGKHGSDTDVICIGQAGENLSRISLTLIDKISHLGRGGLGAVFGAKKLKGIAVRGTKGVKIAKPEIFRRTQDFLTRRALSDRNRNSWIKYGIQGVIETWFKNGLVQIRNKREAPDAEKMIASYGMKAFDDLLDVRPWAGPSCITCDKSIICLKKGEFEGLRTTASVPSLPSIMGSAFNLTLAQAFKCHDLFQRYGIDELDGGYLIELVIDLYEKGLISDKELGFQPKADFNTVLQALEKMSRKEGFWGIVGDGIPAVIQNVNGADKYAIHGRGMIPGFDGRICLGVEAFGDGITNPRGAQSQALVRSPSTAVPGQSRESIQSIAAAYQVPQKARQRIFAHNGVNIARLTPYVQNINSGYNCLGVCYRFFIGRLWNPAVAAGVYHAVTGISLTPEEFVQAGERVWNLQKILNMREGFSRSDYHFPQRWVNEPVRSGDNEIYLQDYLKTHLLTPTDTKKMLDDYFNERGWSLKTSNPTRDKLISLGLEDFTDDHKKADITL
ncbi:MAG: aldehyde ferredoxin oxidoreductase N-terminal domain-containing protein [Chloroflexota bacterium]